MNIYDEITGKMLEQLQSGVAPWHKPWAHPNPSVVMQLPVNGVTGNRYNGVNIPMLWVAADEKAYTTNEYATFNQWASKKEYPRKGEKGNMIVYFDHIEKETDKPDEIEKIPFLKKSIVFNKCQLQSYVPVEVERPTLKENFERLEAVDKFIQNTGASINYDGGNRAYYNRVSDDIHLPEPEMFIGTPTQTPTESLYAVTLHELIHWTGAKHRLDREKGKRFGDKKYAFEEMVAESGAAFSCAHLGITDAPRPDHASYIANWMDMMKADKQAFVSACSQASKALDYMIGLQGV